MSIQDTHKNQLQAKFGTIYCNSQYSNPIYSTYFSLAKNINQEALTKFFNFFSFSAEKHLIPPFLYVIRSNFETRQMFLMYIENFITQTRSYTGAGGQYAMTHERTRCLSAAQRCLKIRGGLHRRRKRPGILCQKTLKVC